MNIKYVYVITYYTRCLTIKNENWFRRYGHVERTDELVGWWQTSYYLVNSGLIRVLTDSEKSKW